MGLVVKFAWIALLALAGCEALSQMSSQGACTKPGEKGPGDGMLTLKNDSWTISNPKGEAATLVITDDSIASSYGFIGVDNVRADLGVAPDIVALQSSLDSLTQSLRSRYGVSALVASIRFGDGSSVASASGFRSTNNRTSARPSDYLMIGSISKSVTSLLIARCIEKGIIGWNTTIQDVFPEFGSLTASKNQSATVWQLMCHRSGLGLPFAPKVAARSSSGTEYRYNLAKEMMSIEPVGLPGSKYHYTSGVTCVVAMIERKSGRTYEQLLDNEVVKPLGLTSFGMGRPHNLHPDNSIIGQVLGSDGSLAPAPDSWQPQFKFDPAGGLHCSILDLGKFGAAMCFGAETSIISDETKRFMFKPPYGDAYALGWATGANSNGTWVMHSGSTALGDTSFIYINPQRKITICFYLSLNAGDETTKEIMPVLTKQLEKLAFDSLGLCYLKSMHGDDLLTWSMFRTLNAKALLEVAH